jgi:uncharacterized protein YgiM (DUF1202 family)
MILVPGNINNERGDRVNYNKIRKSSADTKVIHETRVTKVEEEPKMGTIISPGKLNIREEPTIDSQVIDTVDPDTRVEVHEVHREWSYVYVNNALQGYAMSKYIKIDKE